MSLPAPRARPRDAWRIVAAAYGPPNAVEGGRERSGCKRPV